MIAVAVHPASRIGTVVLAQQPLRWIGERSYGIYLWHWPIFMVTRPGFDTDITGWPNTALRIALTLVAAELSYRFVEEPIRHGSLGRWYRSLRSATGEDRSLMWQRTIVDVRHRRRHRASSRASASRRRSRRASSPASRSSPQPSTHRPRPTTAPTATTQPGHRADDADHPDGPAARRRR